MESNLTNDVYVLYILIMHGLRRCETPPSPPAPDPVGIENCKQLFSPLLAFTTQKIATHCMDIISAVCVPFFWVVNAIRNEKSCLQFLIPTAVFHMLVIYIHLLLLKLLGLTLVSVSALEIILDICDVAKS